MVFRSILIGLIFILVGILAAGCDKSTRAQPKAQGNYDPGFQFEEVGVPKPKTTNKETK